MPLKRAITLGKVSLLYIDTHAALMEKFVMQNNSPISVKALRDMLRDQVSAFEKMQAFQDKMGGDADELFKAAKSADLHAQIQLAEFYLSGKNKQIPADIAKSVFWIEVASLNENNRFLYFDTALALHAAGYMLTSREDVPRNFEKGCYFLHESAKRKYLRAMLDLRYYREQGKCPGFN